MMQLLGIGTLILSALTIPGGGVFANETVELEVQNLRVPSFVRSGEPIKIVGTIINNGDTPVFNLRLGVAVSGADELQKDWEVLEKDPQDVIPMLNPGEHVLFSSKIRLEGDGWIRIGIAGTADNAFLSPEGDNVRLVELSTSFPNAVILLLIFVIVLGVTALFLWLIFRGGEKKPLISIDRPFMILGIVLSTLGPFAVWFLSQTLRSTLVFPMFILFVAGWFTVGAGLRPRGSARKGLLVALIFYLLVGSIWAIKVTTADFDPGRFADLMSPSALIPMVFWPMTMAQTLGLFGLSN
jgi:hypothetical protein